MSLVLVVAAVLFARTLTGLLAKGPGFDTPPLLSSGVDPRSSGYSPADASRLTRRLYDQVRSAPSTQAAAGTRFQLLTGGGSNNPMTIQADRRVVTDRAVKLDAITPGSLATLGIRLLAGRDLDQRDSRSAGGAARVLGALPPLLTACGLFSVLSYLVEQ